jgi:hypothetical protein
MSSIAAVGSFAGCPASGVEPGLQSSSFLSLRSLNMRYTFGYQHISGLRALTRMAISESVGATC